VTQPARFALGAIAELRGGCAFPAALQGQSSGLYPFARAGDIASVARTGQSELGETRNYLDAAGADQLRTAPFPAGTLVFAKTGESIATGHRLVTTRPMFLDVHVMGVVPRADVVRTRYLLHFLRTVDLYALASKTAIPSVRKSTLARLLVPVPPLPEQDRIAAVLDKIEVIRGKSRRAEGLARDFLRSTFLEAFGDPLGNPMAWPTEALPHLCSPRQWPTITADEMDWSAAYPVYGANGVIGRFREFNHAVPTILLSSTGAACGSIHVCAAESYVTGNALALEEPDATRVLSRYLEWALRLRDMQDAITGSGQPQITRQSLERVRVPLPPLERQVEFDGIAASTRATVAKLEKASEACEVIFQALVDRSFGGGP
jgi:type I restriction enzyme S subunit